MINRTYAALAALLCHRAIYGALTAIYAARCFGVGKDVKEIAITLCYLLLVLRR